MRLFRSVVWTALGALLAAAAAVVQPAAQPAAQSEGAARPAAPPNGAERPAAQPEGAAQPEDAPRLAAQAEGAAQQAAQAEDTVRRVIGSPGFKQAAAFVRTDHDRLVRELIALTEIPAPPFKEARRAAAYLAHLRPLGLSDAETDAEGNVMALRKGTGRGGLLAVVAHLDTVFPEGTDVTVKREGTRLMAPGVGDDTRGLAALLSVIRAMTAARLQTTADILFVGSVGEEGEGDLRGVKFLLTRGKYKGRITRFLAIDGNQPGSITRGAVGSRRYRTTFGGPGGHSYGAFGLVNPAYALAAAIAAFADTPVPSTPKTTFNVGVLAGGTSVNAIPSAVAMDVDIRSESCAELKKVDERFLAIVRRAADDENRVRSTREGRVTVEAKVIGDRPCGETPLDSPLLEAAGAVVRAFGLTPSYSIGSTDSNIPMAMGIPALTIGHGGGGGRSHSPDEWTDVDPVRSARGVEILLATVLAAAGVP
jgi:acetylornithine deacetylase/succinyl-diaminopimelate desuccinylase-like protein